MRIPDPKAVTAEEAYLGYKAQIIEESELKPSLYEPYLHFDAWLAYWCGITNTYPTDENENPEMLCDEEALVAYLSGVTDTYPEEIKDPYDVRITGYLRYLCSYRFGRPEYPVTNSEFYLSLLDAPHTSNETPSANIELDTSEGKLIDVKAYGDTFQQTYSGKNLIYTSPRKNSGITFTYDSATGVTGFSGTPSESYAISTKVSVNIPSGVYSMSIEAPKGYRVEIGLYRANNSRTSVAIVEGSTYNTFNINEDMIGFDTTVSRLTSGTYASGSFKLQLESGNQVTSFEPYVGGIPSPNPDYPQDIQVVTGEQTVNVHGKNILPITMASQTLNGITYTVNDDKSITMSGTATSRSEPRLYQAVPGAPIVTLKAGVTYHNSMDTELYWYSTNYKAVGANSNYTATVDETIQFAYIRVENGGTVDTTIYPQLEEGSTATSYEPYQSQDYKVNLTSKNLFDINATSGSYRTAKEITGNSVKVTSTIDGNGYTAIMIPNSGSLLGKSCVLSFSAEASVNDGMVRIFQAKSSAPATLGSGVKTIQGSGDLSDTFTFPNSFGSGFDCFVVLLYPNNGYEAIVTGDYAVYSNLQIEEGSQPTSYQSYFDYELCKIGNYQDYIYKSGNDWYVHKEIGKLDLSTVTGWSENSTKGFYRNAFPSNYGITAGEVKSNIFTYNQTTWGSQGAIGITAGGNLWITPNDPNLTKTSDVPTWMSNKSAILYGVLTTPTDTQITDSTLIGQLNALAGADTYNGKTYIKVTANDPNLPALLKVEAYKY